MGNRDLRSEDDDDEEEEGVLLLLLPSTSDVDNDNDDKTEIVDDGRRGRIEGMMNADAAPTPSQQLSGHMKMHNRTSDDSKFKCTMIKSEDDDV